MNFKQIDRAIRALTSDIREQGIDLPTTQSGRIERLVKIYRRIEPLLGILAALPVLPSNWRGALVLFNQAVASVAATEAPPDEVSPAFKAGKDI